MFIIVNELKEFYSHGECGKVQFVTDFAKADMFDTEDGAKQEWEEFGDGSNVTFEKI